MVKPKEDAGQQFAAVKQDAECRRWLAKLPCPTILLDKHNTIIFVNAAFTRISGYLQREIVGKQPPYPFWPDQKQAQYLDELQRKSGHFQRLMRKKSGDSWWVGISLSEFKKKGAEGFRIITFQDKSDLKLVKEKYQIARAQIKKILDAIPVPISISSADDQTFTEVNTSFKESSGYSRREMIGRQIYNLPWANQQVSVQKAQDTLKLAQIGDVELSLKDKSGTPRTSILKARKVKFGEKEYIVAVSIDITDRKKAEESLFASEYRYSSTLENILEGCQIIGFDWRCLFINEASVKQRQIRKEDALGKTITEVVQGIEKTDTFKAMQNCMLNRVSCQIESEHIYEDGSSCWFELDIHPVPEGIFILSVDINDRKIAEDEARRLLIQQQAILDNIPDAAWLKDRDLRFIAVNKAQLNTVKLTADQVLGKTDLDLFPESASHKYWADDRNVIENGVALIVEDHVPDPYGEKVWLETSKSPLFNEKGEVIGLVGIARDITGRKKNQIELQQLNHVLKAIRNVNQIITHEKDPQKLLESVCDSLTDIRGYEVCWMAELDTNNRMISAADSKLGAIFDNKKASLKEGILPHCAREVLTHGKPLMVQPNALICQDCPAYRSIAENCSILVIPIKYGGVIQGVLSVTAGPSISVDDEEIKLMQEMSNDIGLALYNIWLEKQRTDAETKLRISEERFRIISEVAQDIIYRINLEPVPGIDYISPSFEILTGFSLNEIKFDLEWILGLLHPEDSSLVSRLLKNPFGSGTVPYVLRWRHKLGHYIHVEHRHSTICDEAGKPVAIIGIARDITQRIEMEEKIKASEEFSQGLLEEAPNPILVVNEDGTMRYANPALLNLTGFTKEEVFGNSAPCPWWPEDKITEYSKRAKSNYNLEKVEQEWVFKKKSGELFWVEITVTKSVHNSKIDYFLSTWVDVTKRHKAEEALRESEAYTSALLNNEPVPILVMNADGSIRYVNPAMLSLTGFSKDEVIGHNFPHPWWHGENFKQHMSIAEHVQRVGIAVEELTFQKKNGERFWAFLTIKVIWKENKVDYVLSTWIDITERKKAELALKASEEYSSRLLNYAPDPIIVSNSDTSIKFVNRAFEKLTGFKHNELKGIKMPFPWWLPVDVDGFMAMGSPHQARDIDRIEHQYRKKNGELFWVSLSVNKIRDKNGEDNYYIANWVDITERKAAEQALQQSEEKIRLIFTSIGDGVLIADPQGNIIDCNDSAVRMLGDLKSKITAQNVSSFLSMEDRRQVLEMIPNSINDRYNGHRQYTLVRPDGSTFPVDTTSNIARDKNGNPLYLVISFQDITERKNMENRILDLYETEKKQRKELQEEAKARGMFIDVLAHELRTPLTPILASSGMMNDLLDISKEPILKKLCANISDGADILAHRLEELLDVARYSRGVFRLNRSPVNLRTFISEALIRFKPTLDQRNQYLNSSISDELPLALIDPSRMEQVIINLLSNASKFSLENSNIYFKAICQDEVLNIEVRDEGIGITAEEQSRLFQPYHRVEQDRQKFPGIGLGLAVSKQIVEAHDGKILVESQLGQGSTFTIRIPLKKFDIQGIG